MSDKKIFIESIEETTDDYGKAVKIITDKAGDTHKIKRGKMGEKWDNLSNDDAGKCLVLKMGEYKGHPYVQDFEFISDVFEQKAIEKVQTDEKNNSEFNINKRAALDKVTQLIIADKIAWKDIEKDYYHILSLLEPTHEYPEMIMEVIHEPDKKTDKEDDSDRTEPRVQRNHEWLFEQVRNHVTDTKGNLKYAKLDDDAIEVKLIDFCGESGWSYPDEKDIESFYQLFRNNLKQKKQWKD